MALPLKKTILFTVTAVAVVLGGLLSLGVRQYGLHREHEQLSLQNERIIFQAAIIREHVTEALLEKGYHRLTGVAAEIEELNANLSRILDNRNVADEYKIGIVNSIDLPGLILLLQKVERGEAGAETLRQLNGATRTLGERLMLFDRVLVNLAKTRLISFQNIVIGVLSIVVCLITLLMLLLNRHVVKPLLNMNGQAQELLAGRRDRMTPAPGEIGALAGTIAGLVSRNRAMEEESGRWHRMTEAVGKARQAIVPGKNRDLIFKEVCRALLGNENYCLVWFGLLDEEDGGILPVSADGSTTMNSKECEICMTVLLTDAEEKGVAHNPAAAALQRRGPVVHRDILAGIPKGLLKGTALAAGYAACAAFPLLCQGKGYGVLSIYSTSPDSFEPGEMELLETVAGHLSLVLGLQEARAEERRQETRLAAVLQALKGGLLGISPAGLVVEGRGLLEQYGCQEEVAGNHWRRILSPEEMERVEGKDDAALLAEFAAGGNLEMVLHWGEVRRALAARFFKTTEREEKAPLYHCLLWDGGAVPQGSWVSGPASSRQLAVMGELAVGTAHEIGDLNNGMINYAQALADELNPDTLPPEQRYMLDKILASGERIAAIAKKLIYYGQENGRSSEFKPLVQVLDDALELYGSRLRSDGVQAELHQAGGLPEIQVKAQQMLAVFLQLLGNARRGLNHRYPQKDAAKRLEIRCTLAGEEGGRELVVELEDHGRSIHPDDLPGIFEPDFTARGAGAGEVQGLAFSREIVRKQGGTISAACGPDEATVVRLAFPLSCSISKSSGMVS